MIIIQIIKGIDYCYYCKHMHVQIKAIMSAINTLKKISEKETDYFIQKLKDINKQINRQKHCKSLFNEILQFNVLLYAVVKEMNEN